MDSKFIADRITELRLKKNVSEYQMSLDLGRNKTYIQSITSGRNLPKMNHFLDICDYLGVTPMEFFDDELHHIPLQQKANELLKQLDEEDLLAVISILNRLAAKHKEKIMEIQTVKSPRSMNDPGDSVYNEDSRYPTLRTV